MNNNDTITLHSSTHGTFTVTSSHLAGVANAHSGWALDALHSKINGLVGQWDFADYTDLTWVEALIVLSYLTGGVAVPPA